MVGRRNVALAGDRLGGGGSAGRRDYQAVQEVIQRSELAGEVNETNNAPVKTTVRQTMCRALASGIFAGIFTYCLIVLRSIRGGIYSERGRDFWRRAGDQRHRRAHFLHSSHRRFDSGVEHHCLGGRRNPGGH